MPFGAAARSSPRQAGEGVGVAVFTKDEVSLHRTSDLGGSTVAGFTDHQQGGNRMASFLERTGRVHVRPAIGRACQSSESAVPGSGLVDPPIEARRDERRHVHHRLDAAFVADEMDVTAIVNEKS